LKGEGQATAGSTVVGAVLVIAGAAVASGGVLLGADVFARTTTVTQTSTTVQTQSFTLTQTSITTSIETVTVTAYQPASISEWLQLARAMVRNNNQSTAFYKAPFKAR